ncbi:DNA-binding response regulator [Serinibacter arcticus]|uniref:DNA-binding response regulator n=1 Tax=Serinibacter arcticus TaxID=1655435 RepID=A0A2U2A051_9MICO|nr:DNA-binding response regulator [Serinibacter arcticus]
MIEDDPDIRRLLETVLGQAGFVVHSASNGGDGVALASEVDPLVITLDVNLPDIDGFEVARRIRTLNDAYIVMLTARDDEIDTLSGLDVGADDYMTKPFRPRELRARIEAMLRRPRAAPPLHGTAAVATAHGPSAASSGPGTTAPGTDGATAKAESPWGPPPAVVNGLRVDREARTVEVDGAGVSLTRSEFDILASLWASCGRVVTKNDLVRALWGEEYDAGTRITPSDHRSVEVHMANLRRKIGEDTSRPRWIDTVRGVGYRLNAPRPDRLG